MDLLDRVYRRIVMLVGRGRLTSINDAGVVQLVQIKLGADEVRDGMPRLAEYGFTSNPPAGTDAVATFLAGDRSNGVVIATGNQVYRLVGLASGDVAIYDSRGQSVWLTPSGIVVNGGGLPMKITNTTQVRMETALLEVTGDIQDNCDAQTRTMATMRSIYDGHTHTVPNIQGGSSTATTNTPTQQE